MKISSFQLKNYKSFIDSGELKLTDGINLLIGQNNVGKTALMEALSLKFEGKPHRSLLTKKHPTSIPNPYTEIQLKFTVTGPELKDLLLGARKQYSIPIPAGLNALSGEDGIDVINSILERPEITFVLGLISSPNNSPNWKSIRFPTLEHLESTILKAGTNNANFFNVQPNSDGSEFNWQKITTQNIDQEFGFEVGKLLKERIYAFRAERLPLSKCPVGTSPVLAPNASNLPEVLNLLQGNTHRFNRFNSVLNKIFPSICQVSVNQLPNNQLEILVWTEDPRMERVDLAIELSESGTGVSQVLAILYVVLNSDFPRTILIDEPNSFLHPAAARKLIEILKSFPQHQYILSTHSPEILRISEPKTLTLLKWEKPKTELECLTANEIDSVARCLSEVGAKLSDVFGADNILWVEGETEEQCFPKILAGSFSVVGTNIVAVRNTGDFESKKPNPQQIFDIYKNLSKGNALIPPAIGFVFDKETRRPEEIEDLSKRSGGLVSFLTRRTFENYILSSKAIAAVLNTLPTFEEKPITEERVAQWLTENGGKSKFITPPLQTVNLLDDVWLEKVNAPRLLADLFQELSGNQESYRKTLHSVKITEWIIENEPSRLKPLTDLLIFHLNRTGSTLLG